MTELFDLRFQRKFKSFQDLCKSLAFRAACQIQTRQWNKDKTLPKEAPGYALVDYQSSDGKWIFFEYCGMEYDIRVWSISEDERDRKIGFCTVYEAKVSDQN